MSLDLVMECQSAVTLQSEPGLHVRTGETVLCKTTVSKGLPIAFSVNWGDGRTTNVSRSDKTEDPSFQVDNAYPEDGSYNVTVTGQNLHSYPTGTCDRLFVLQSS